jgi:hypothetical protein
MDVLDFKEESSVDTLIQIDKIALLVIQHGFSNDLFSNISTKESYLKLIKYYCDRMAYCVNAVKELTENQHQKDNDIFMIKLNLQRYLVTAMLELDKIKKEHPLLF